MRKNGFTLIEVVIAVLILAIISALTAVSIQSSQKGKKRIDTEVEQYAAVRDAVNVIAADVGKAFHWRDINEEVEKKLKEEQKAAAGATGEAGSSNQFTTSKYPTPIPSELVSAFIGTANTIDFTTLSNERTKANSPESDQAEVGYFTKAGKSIKTGESTKVLVKRVSPYLDGDVSKGGKESTLLEDVIELKFRYLGGDNKEWKSDWRSDRVDDSVTGKKFPNAVEIEITAGKDKRQIKVKTIALIHNPNNQDFFGTPAPGSAPAGGSGQGTPAPTP